MKLYHGTNQDIQSIDCYYYSKNVFMPSAF